MQEENQEYISVADFAELAGVTQTAVYNRIKNGSLDDYIKIEDNIKMIKPSAADQFKKRIKSKKEPEPPVQESSLNIIEVQTEVQEAQEESKAKEKELLKALEDNIAFLKDQISTKDDQILKLNENLERELTAKNSQIDELNKQIEKLNDHLTFANNLVDQSHRLNAAEKMKTLVEDTTVEEPEKKWWQFWK